MEKEDEEGVESMKLLNHSGRGKSTHFLHFYHTAYIHPSSERASPSPFIHPSCVPLLFPLISAFIASSSFCIIITDSPLVIVMLSIHPLVSPHAFFHNHQLYYLLTFNCATSFILNAFFFVIRIWFWNFLYTITFRFVFSSMHLYLLFRHLFRLSSFRLSGSRSGIEHRTCMDRLSLSIITYPLSLSLSFFIRYTYLFLIFISFLSIHRYAIRCSNSLCSSHPIPS